MTGPAAIPRSCDTAAVLVNVTRFLMATDGASYDGASYLAERALGLADSPDPLRVRQDALRLFHSTKGTYENV
jgi:hypothetical protein